MHTGRGLEHVRRRGQLHVFCQRSAHQGAALAACIILVKCLIEFFSYCRVAVWATQVYRTVQFPFASCAIFVVALDSVAREESCLAMACSYRYDHGGNVGKAAFGRWALCGFAFLLE